jgi:uncharacterized protein involved in exopolysaccharide biosynthesis
MSGSRDIEQQPPANEVGHPEESEVLGSAALVAITGRTAGKVYPLLAPDLVIGRGSGAHVRVDDKPVSSRHARIARSGDGHVLIDLGSTNGTFLNSKRLVPQHPVDLVPGDSIQVAETIFAYLPPGARSPQDQTQYLSKLIPQLPGSTALKLADGGALPDVQVLARLLQAQPIVAETASPPIEERIESIVRILKLIRRNWLTLFAAAALGALAGDARVLMRPPLAEATFRIRITPDASNDELKAYDRDNRGFYTATEQAFLSRSVVEQSLKSLGVKDPGKGQIDYVLSSLTFDSAAFMTFEGKFASRDPEYAVRYLRRHVENFLAGEVTKTIRVVQTEVDFLTSRVKEREDELRKTEAALRDFKANHLEGLPEFTSGHITSREALFARRADLSAQLTRSNLELAAARKRLTEAAPLLASKMAGAAPFEQGLIDVRKKLSEARAKGLGEQHSEVVALVRQQADLERMAQEAKSRDATALERGANPGLIDLKNRVTDFEVASKGAGAELGEVNAQLARLEKLVKTMPEVEARYAELTRSYGANKELHAKLFADLRSSQLALDMARASARARFEIMAAPESSGVPLRQALVKGASVGGLLGLIVGMLIAGILEFRRYLRGRRLQTTAIVRAEPWTPPR